MTKYKNGIYEGDYGVSYFIKDGRVLLKHLGTMYKATPHFVFGNYKYPLTDDMNNTFEEVYNNEKVKQW